MDQRNICKVFHDYFAKLKENLFTQYPETVNLSDFDKMGVFSYIYDYAMMNIYKKIFPNCETERDLILKKKFEKLQLWTPEQLRIKHENYHLEFIDFYIKSYLNIYYRIGNCE